VKWPRANPGEYLHDISILRPVSTVGSSGPKTNYEPFVRSRAKITQTSAADTISAGQTVSSIAVIIQMPYQPDIDSNMHVLAGSDTYVIKDIEDVLKMHLTLILTCSAIKGNQ
jgi:head-tail adaptor